MTPSRVRFVVDEPHALCAEFIARGVPIQTALFDTAWGTRELALYDPDRNALTFYRAR